MTNSSIKWFSRGLISIVILLSACNIFNPSGEGDLPDSTEGMISVGQSRLKEKDFSGALIAFAAAIKDDSTNSLAYYSYAKAARFEYELNGLTLSKALTDTAGGNIPFIDTKNKVATEYLRATIRIKPVLSILANRDSLTRWFKYLSDKEDAIESDDNARKRIRFIENYLDSADNNPGLYKRADFPLMDGVINYEKILPDLTMIILVHAIIQIKDLNGDTTINENDNIQLVDDILGALDTGDVEENLKNIMDDIMNDTNTAKRDSTVKDFNAALDNLGNGLDDVGLILDASSAMGGLIGADESDSASGELTEDIQGALDSIGDANKFWRIADSLDNDGDGCVDEEIFDNKDNDGDGLVDEDFRLEPVYMGATILDPSTRENFVDRSVIGTKTVTILPDSNRIEFTTATGFWSENLDNNKRFKIIDITAGQKPPYNLSADDLTYAKENIGGCWKFY